VTSQTGRASLVAKIGITLTVLTLSACTASASGSQPPKSSTSTTSPISNPSSTVSTSPTATTSSSSPPTLVSLVAATPKGFTSEAIDKVDAGPTGSLVLDAASSADCDAGQVRQDHWVASELRYFDDDPAFPATYLLLCVTQLSSSANAKANQEQVVKLSDHPLGGFPALKHFTVTSIPGAVGNFVDSYAIVQVFFAKGPYYVFAAGAGLSTAGSAAVQSLVTALARTQYNDLSA
jgi:hypothetical protein